MNNMINAIANYALNEIERASQDEFERHIFLKSYAVAYTSANFLQLVIAAILAWVLPGKLSFLSLLVLVPLLVGSTVASAWLRNHVARPQARRSWTAMIVYFIPMIVMLAGIAYNAYPPADGSRATSHRSARRLRHRPHPHPIPPSPPESPRPGSPRCQA